MKTHILGIGTVLVFTAGGLMAAAPETNTSPAAATAPAVAPAPAPTAAAPADAPVEGAKPSWNSFVMITRNNIFDPQRVPYTGAPRVAQAPVRTVQEFDLNGVALKEGKGYTAFFEGYGVRNAEQSVGDTVADFKIANINVNGVELINTRSATNDVINVPVLHGLKRINGGEWTAAVTVPIYLARQRMAPRIPTTPTYAYTPSPMYTQPDYSADPSGYDPSQDLSGTTGRRGRRGVGGGGGGGRTRGGGGGGGFGNFGTQDDTTAAPAAPIDPIVLQRLQLRRQQEGGN